MKKDGGYITNCLESDAVYKMLCKMASAVGKFCWYSNGDLKNPYFFIRNKPIKTYNDINRGDYGDCVLDSVVAKDSQIVSLEKMIQILRNFKKSPPKIVEFVYKKDNGQTAWRKIQAESEDNCYIKGIDLEKNEFRSFLKSRIVGGRILEVKK